MEDRNMAEGSERRPDRSRLPQIRFCPRPRSRTKVRTCRLPVRRVFESGDADAPKLWPRFPLKVTKALPNPTCDVRPELRVDPDRV